MIRYFISCFISFIIGVIVTYVGNFIFIASSVNGLSTGYFIANAFIVALPTLMIIVSVIFASIIFIWFLNWWTDQSVEVKNAADENARSIVMAAHVEKSDIIADAHTQAHAIRREANNEASKLLLKAEGKYSIAERLEIQREQERMDLETEYQNKFAALENREQNYLDEIASWIQRFDRLKEALRNAKKAGCKKLRERGEIVAAERTERKIEKELSAY